MLVVVAGIASRRCPHALPAALGKYPGDALWTVLAFTLIGIARPRASTLQVGSAALAISVLVECQQMLQMQWLISLRASTLGHLVLGSTFAWGDLCACAIGAALAVLLELGPLATQIGRNLILHRAGDRSASP